MTRKLLSSIAKVVCHLIGIGAVFSGTFWVYGTPEVARAAAHAWEWGLLEQNLVEIAVQFLLAGCLWGLAFGLFSFGWRALSEHQKAPRRVVLTSRGTIMTETLITLPVLLLLVLGLLQLTLNNTAAIFTSLSAFQAARTVHLWHPESTDWGRNGGVSKAEIEDRATIAAASVLAPVTASNYKEGCSTSSRFDAKLEAMMSVTAGAPGSLGLASASAVKAVAAGKPLPFQGNLNVAKAYDSDSFMIRGPVKMYIAYCMTEATYQNRDGNHRVSVRFSNKQTMPLVGRVFGDVRSTGIYADVERMFVIPQQINPNPYPPVSFLSIGFWNPFSDWK